VRRNEVCVGWGIKRRVPRRRGGRDREGCPRPLGHLGLPLLDRPGRPGPL